VVALAVAAAAACSYPTAETPYPGVCAPMHPTRWAPFEGALGVPTDLTVQVFFSDYPDPETVSESSVLLTTGVYRVPENYRVDLANKAVKMKPDGPLNTNLGYTVSVQKGVTSLAGCSGPFAEVQFTTGDGPANVPPPPVPAFADIQAIFTASCAGGCHADPSGACLPAPFAGLSLCAGQARASLIDVPSREVSSLALVAPLDSAQSYLLRKILPATTGGGPIPGTLGELEPPTGPLDPAQIQAIAAWIDGGALP
jgi:hypothetical protein